jgi:hypothetical protein
MKLKDFLKYIPDDCEVGLLSLSRTIYISYGLMDEAIDRMAYKYKLVRDQILNMDVAHVYAGVCVESYNTEYLSNSAYPIDLFPKLIIELE